MGSGANNVGRRPWIKSINVGRQGTLLRAQRSISASRYSYPPQRKGRRGHVWDRPGWIRKEPRFSQTHKSLEHSCPRPFFFFSQFPSLYATHFP
jgi:hypothetical protein